MKPTTQQMVRSYLRHELGTWPEGPALSEWIDRDAIEPAVANNQRLAEFINRLREIGELFVGMANGPFLLVLRASAPEAFINYANQHPTHNVHITFEAAGNRRVQDRNADVQGSIRPVGAPDAYTLSFGLPHVLREYILFDEDRGIRLAPGLKRKFFSDITVYRREHEQDVLYRLTYEPQPRLALRGL